MTFTNAALYIILFSDMRPVFITSEWKCKTNEKQNECFIPPKQMKRQRFPTNLKHSKSFVSPISPFFTLIESKP